MPPTKFLSNPIWKVCGRRVALHSKFPRVEIITEEEIEFIPYIYVYHVETMTRRRA